MFSLFENLLAARNKPKDGDWIEFVVIIVIIGFSIIKTLFRAKSAVFERQPEQDDDSSPKPQPVPKRYTSDGEYKTIQQIRDEKRAQIRAAFGIPTPPEERKLVSTPLPKPPRPVKRIEKPVFHAKARLPAKEVSKKPSGVPAPPQTKAGDVYESLFSSPQDLRSAILYSEILGKPVSLRDAV